MIVVKIAVFYVLLFSLIPKKVVANDESTGVPSKYMICFSLYFCICTAKRSCRKFVRLHLCIYFVFIEKNLNTKKNGSVRDYKY